MFVFQWYSVDAKAFINGIFLFMSL